jgi:phosphoribosyl 1,2-cyclic phosphodiesterase
MLGYLADLGTWTTDLVAAVADVDLLALEFNHDVQLEKQSGRPQDLIDRVLGDSGHLSNKQAADFVVELRRQQGAGRLRELVQLHLSQVCNHPTLARRTADEAVADWPLPPRIHTSLPHQAGTILEMPVAAG